MEDPDLRLRAGQRLGAQENLGISTLEPSSRPTPMPQGRRVSIRVLMLDDTEELFDISHRAPGKFLFDMVCTRLHLDEGDYFGLEFQDRHKMTVWLDLLKPIVKQIKRPKHMILHFVVKFFLPDHTQLKEELTRYLFALQIKRDLACGRLTCNDTSAALLVSHIVQSEIGDFDEALSGQQLMNNTYVLDQEGLLDRIAEFHRKHMGQTPAESDFQLLEVARKLEMYGIRLHPAKDREGTKLSLAVAHTGILVFQGHMKINAFNWSRVRKLSFKRKRFLIKLRPDLNNGTCQDVLEFLMASRDCCKVFWKICVEYHAFFRLLEEPKPKPKAVLFTRGSSFRFSGRTQRQVMDYVRDSEFKKIPFERKHSKIQSVSRLPLLPSLLQAEVPNEQSEGCDPEDQLNSHARHSQRDSINGADSGSPRDRRSPARLSAHEDGAGPLEEEGRSRTPPPRPTSTGLTPQTTKGSSFYMPYTNKVDIDSEYAIFKGLERGSAPTAQCCYKAKPDIWPGGVHEAYKHREWEHTVGRFRHREPPPSYVHSLGVAGELAYDELLSRGLLYSGRPDYAPSSSSLVDEIFRASSQRSPRAPRHIVRSKTPDPAMSAPYMDEAFKHSSQNGHISWANSWGNNPNTGGRSPQIQRLAGTRSPVEAINRVLGEVAPAPARQLSPPRSEWAQPLGCGVEPSSTRQRHGHPDGDQGPDDHEGDCAVESSESEPEACRQGSPRYMCRSSSPKPRRNLSVGSVHLEGDVSFTYSTKDRAAFRCSEGRVQ